MASQQIPGFKSLREIIMATMVVGSTMTIASTATAVTLKVSVENIGPTNGSILPPVWVAFQDGSFDTFDVGAPASSGIKDLAEDGISGLESTFLGDSPILSGVYNIIPQNSTISSLFAGSSAGINGGVQGVLSPDPDIQLYPNAPVLFPGQTSTKTITLNGSVANHRYFNYVSQVFPSNDAFIGNDHPIEIFDAEGKFIGANFIVLGNQVLDAGTTVNDEDQSRIGFPSETRSPLDALGKGIPENGTIQIHPGLKPAGTGGVLDYELGGNKLFANADFKAPGYEVARITVTEVPESVPEPAPTTGLLALSGLFMLLRQVRRSV